MININNKKKKLKGFHFIDLFAGIGGFHYALSSFGAECVFASEWDKSASEVYTLNHKVKPYGDITLIDAKLIPQHDILCAGFPCQAFSVSGNQKGFEDTRGTLFFDIARIIKKHKPKVLFLENVRNLVKHDNGKTMDVILTTLDSLGYKVYYKVLNTSNYGLPQNRQRTYIVGFNKDISIKKFNFPTPIEKRTSLSEFLEINPPNVKIVERDDINMYKEIIINNNLFNKKELPNKPLQIGKVNKGGQGERIYHTLGHAITLSAYGGGVGAKTGLYKINNKIRKLSPRECANIQGFPEDFKFHPKDSQSYKQFGNSVSVNVLQKIIEQIIKSLDV
tara:strand:+ start:704 stop:1705 length:1002 start_codon:yes stop_codon:yes gene_type:complete